MKKIAGNPYLKYKKGQILIDDFQLDALLEENNTPFFVFMENRIIDNINTLRETFNTVFEEVEYYYSFKANYLSEISKLFQSENVGAELVGELELNLALENGFSPNQIILGGPYLPQDLIFKSIQHGIKEIIVYNLNDLERVNTISQQMGIIQNICIRINSTKYKSKLGVELTEKNCNLLSQVIKNSENIEITSILSHMTTQMNNINQYRKNLEAIAFNLRKLRKIDINIKNLNLGGGFPEATVMKKDQLRKIASLLKNFMIDLKIPYQKLYFEPGRYFVGDSAVLIAEVIKVDEDRSIFLNIGNHICPKFAKASLRFYNITRMEEAHKYATSIYGIVPTNQDVLAKNYFFSENIKEGDKVLITNVGAYTLTFSNRFPYLLPKIFLIRKNEVKTLFNPKIDHDFSLKSF